MATRKRQRGITDWRRVDRLSDDEIRRAVEADPDAAPIVPAEWFKRARLVDPKPKKAVSLNLDEDLLRWFKKQGKAYQTRINGVLRAYVDLQT
jgi:uncharacterized protein (DUF4415 family)